MISENAPSSRERLRQVRLYVVTDAAAHPDQVVATVDAACRGGADCIQLRRKGDSDRELLRLAEACRAVTARWGVLFIVDDRLDVAMAVGADGVHLGQEDLPVAAARRLWPSGLVGCSTHSLSQAREAAAEGADYLGVGPVFATPTKPGRPPVGTELVHRVATADLGIPWVAIGGIDGDNVAEVVAAGAPAIAVVRAVCAAADPERATRRLREQVVAALRRVLVAQVQP